MKIFKFKTHEDDYLSITRMIICSALSSQVVWLLPSGKVIAEIIRSIFDVLDVDIISDLMMLMFWNKRSFEALPSFTKLTELRHFHRASLNSASFAELRRASLNFESVQVSLS